ncbi:MAG TPA: DUF1015 domain-containing protein [Ktedonobacterales bacterium]|jgi:uncharacterized protein (DUF1015 family)
MAEIRPFSGIQYASEFRSRLAELVTPPYDVISPEQQNTYYQRDPNNIIRLELGRDEPGDDRLNNRYTRAAAAFAEWRMQGIMRQESQPVMYLYRQGFPHDGRTLWRTSLLTAVRLEPWEAGVVLPHEHTMSKPKDDRLKLLRACAANLSPLMSLYEDPQGQLSQLLVRLADQQPEVQFTDDAHEQHWLLAIRDSATLKELQAFFATRKLFMADGHHRYETALAYRDEIREMRKELHPDDAANFVLMSLSAFEDPGLVILPTHRIVKGVSTERLSHLSEKLQERFLVERMSDQTPADLALAALEAEGGLGVFVVVTPEQMFRLKARPIAKEPMAATGRSTPWCKLDVAMLQTLVMDQTLGLSVEAVTRGDFLSYTRNAADAIAAVRSGKAQLAVLLRPTRVEQLRDVAAIGEKMPQKSTYFYPKLITGLVIHPLW